MPDDLTHHVNLALLRDPEFTLPMLLNALMAKLHRALHDLAAGQAACGIGISFPRQQAPHRPLGDLLRLHGDQAQLQALMARPWLTGLRDHLEPWRVQPDPSETLGRLRLRRVDAAPNPDKLRRRWLRRHPGADAAEAAAYAPGPAARPNLPFLSLTSRSNGQPYRLHIHQQRLQASEAQATNERAESAPSPGFNTFGLSRGAATVPWF